LFSISFQEPYFSSIRVFIKIWVEQKNIFFSCPLILFSTTGNINLHEKARHLKLCFISLGIFCLILRGQICIKFIPTLICGEIEMAMNVVLG
jgi:hypothetical protein